jgi:Tfp pilus assembly protein PilF
MSYQYTGRAILAIVMAGGSVSCNRSPQAREAAYLKSAEALAAKRDFARARLDIRNASQAMPNDAEPYYRSGLIDLQSDDPLRAMVNFRKALELNPNHTGAKLKVGELLALSGRRTDVEEAARRLTEAVAESSGAPEPADGLAFTEIRLGKLEDAEELLRATMSKFPSHLQSAVQLARLKLARKDLAGAEEVLRNVVKNAPESSAAALALGRFHMLTGKLAEAERELKTAIKLDANNGPALIDLAAIQLHDGRKQEAEQSYRQVSALPGYKPVHALFLYHQGRWQDAIAEFEQLARADPNDRAARSRLVAAFLAINQRPNAERVLNEALKRNSKDVDALIQRSRLYLDERRTMEAEADLEQALHFRPDSPEALLALANLYRVLGQSHLEQQELERILSRNPRALPARLQLARSYTASNKASSALDLLTNTPKAQQHSVLVLVERNWALFSLGQKEQLRAGIAEGEAAGPSPEWSLQSGLLKFMQGAYGPARADAEEFVRQQPADVRGARLIAQTYAAQKRPGEAVDRLRELASRQPKSAALQEIYGDWLARTGNRAAARGAYEAAKAADSKSFAPDLRLADMDLADRKFDAARQTAGSVIAREPHNLRALLLLADVDQKTNRDGAAIADYRAALDADDGNVFVLNNLAWLDAAVNPDEALGYAQKALEADPDNATIKDTLGWIYYRKGIFNVAVDYLRQAVDREPTPKRQFHLAMSYIKAGDHQRGEAMLQLALSKDPSLPRTETGW